MRLYYFRTTAAILALAAGVTLTPIAVAQQSGGASGKPYYTVASGYTAANGHAAFNGVAVANGLQRLPAPEPQNEASPSDITSPATVDPTAVPGMPPMKGVPQPTPAAPGANNEIQSKAAAQAARDANAELTQRLEKLTKQVEDLTSLREDLERVDKVEETLDKHLEGLAKKAADAAKKPQQKFFGRIHLDSWSFHKDSPGIGFFENDDATDPTTFGNDPQDHISFRRIRLGMKGDILDTMTYKVQTEFSNPNNFEYRDLYIGWKQLPGNQLLLLGNQKRPLGLDHLNSSRYNTFLERPAVIEAFNEDARRIGLTMYGHNNEESLNWTYGVYNLERTADDGRFIGDSLQLSLNGRVSGSPWYDETSGGRGYLHLGLAGMYARPDGDEPSGAAGDVNSNDGRFRTRSELRSATRWLDTGRIANAEHYEIAAAEMMLNVGAFQLVSEYQTAWTQIGGADDVFFHGGYVQASYFLTGEHIPLSRSSGTIGRVKPYENFFLVDRLSGGTGWGLGAWQVAARYSFLDLTDGAVQGGEGSTFTAGMNWWWTPYSRVQMNYLYGQIDDHSPVGGFTGGNFHAIGTRWMVDF